jgi:predicted transposase/invertase (TIGR01784 family)
LKSINNKFFKDNRSRYKKIKNYETVKELFRKYENQENVIISPMDDFLFITTFGKKGNEILLKSLINSIFKDKNIPEIDKLEILDVREQKVDRKKGKKTVLDIRAKADDDIQINIEAQQSSPKDFKLRILYYFCGEIKDSIDEGDKYSDIPNMVQIIINSKNMFEYEEFHNTFHLSRDGHINQYFSEDFRIHTIEIPKFIDNVEIDLNDPLHRWLLFLNPYTSNETMEEIMELDPVIKMAKTNGFLSTRRCHATSTKNGKNGSNRF